ncbi:MAG TPA: GNAT family N-acetyltransferase [Flavihumibacter sp.]|nr:N-acetyltransferase [Bacteroidota bacterium]HPZ89460.1 GNAT family N-acetyltransferase [Flavihumibacter sp.]HQD10030.1 GNAT family N-acetyltransferase [Flavihumibacter sp.]
MQIQHKEGAQGAFYIEENGKQVAEMTYSLPVTGKMIIDHTEVSEALEGKGIARQLLDTAVAWAREEHLKIIPVCPYAHAVMMKNKDQFADVLL